MFDKVYAKERETGQRDGESKDLYKENTELVLKNVRLRFKIQLRVDTLKSNENIKPAIDLHKLQTSKLRHCIISYNQPYLIKTNTSFLSLGLNPLRHRGNKKESSSS